MKQWRTSILCMLALLLSGASALSVAQENRYALGTGDVISVYVFGEEDLTVERIRLGDSGKFSYPFIGEVSAQGLTLAALEAFIVKQLLAGYLVSPKVTVRIIEYRDFFVNGEVKRPGGYPFKPGLTVRKAIALAGGFSERAARSKVQLIRDTGASRKPESVGLDVAVYPGDIITIEQSFF
jgi:protein involved in polysaccharide export with SLBB domain